MSVNHKNNFWNDSNLMFDDIKNHPFKVVRYDSPKKLIIGYKSIGDGTIWLLKLSKFYNVNSEYLKFTQNELLDYLNLTNDERIIKNIIE